MRYCLHRKAIQLAFQVSCVLEPMSRVGRSSQFVKVSIYAASTSTSTGRLILELVNLTLKTHFSNWCMCSIDCIHLSGKLRPVNKTLLHLILKT